MVDVDDPPGEPVADVRAEDLHVPGEDDEIDSEFLDEGEQLFVGLGSCFGRDGDVAEFDAFTLNDVAQVLVIGDDDGDFCLELSRMVTIQEVEKTVIVFGDQNHDARAIVHSPHAKSGPKLLDAGREVVNDLLWVVEIVFENGPHHEHVGVMVGELLVRNDVRVQLEQSGGETSNDASGVRAGECEDELVHGRLRLLQAATTLSSVVNIRGTCL